MIKVTANGETIVGNNEDFFNKKTRIWFEPGKKGQHGAVYVGFSDMIPQGGMNGAGLAYDGFANSYKKVNNTAGKKRIDSIALIRKAMRQCATVEDVNNLISQYDISYWSGAVLLYVDRTGKYLVVDGDSLIIGDKPLYVLTNFHPSDVNDENDITCPRYRKAMEMLNNRIDTSIDYCASIMNAMHAEGPEINTLYTSLYDLNKGIVYLYNFHDYTRSVSFNVKEKLKGGKKVLNISDLFSKQPAAPMGKQ